MSIEIEKQNTRLNGLMFKALDHGVNSVRNGGPLVPFVMTEKSLHRFENDLLEVAKEKAESYLSQLSNEQVVALAYDGYITTEDGAKYDAIFIKAFDRHESRGILLAQRYKPKKFLGKLETIGNPALVEYIDNPLLK